jgi:hypothetical protein
MSMVIASIFFLMTGVISVFVLNVMASLDLLRSRAFAVISGTTTGALTGGFLDGIIPFTSFLEHSLTGKVGFAGYFMLISFVIMIITFATNFQTQKGSIVQ